MSRRTRAAVKSDPGTRQQRHSVVHAEHRSAHEQPSFRKTSSRVLGPKKGGKA